MVDEECSIKRPQWMLITRLNKGFVGCALDDRNGTNAACVCVYVCAFAVLNTNDHSLHVNNVQQSEIEPKST